MFSMDLVVAWFNDVYFYCTCTYRNSLDISYFNLDLVLFGIEFCLFVVRNVLIVFLNTLLRLNRQKILNIDVKSSYIESSIFIISLSIKRASFMHSTQKVSCYDEFAFKNLTF